MSRASWIPAAAQRAAGNRGARERRADRCPGDDHPVIGFTLTHQDANTFTFPLETSVAAVTFAIGSAGWATGATIAELVTFVRS